MEHTARTGEEEKCIPGSGGNALRKDTFRPREQQRQCTYSVTVRRVRATIVAVEKE